MSHASRAARALRRWLPWAAVSLAAGVAAVGGSYLAVGWQRAFVVDPFEGFVVATSPDALIGFAIEVLGDLGHQLAFLTAISLACLALAAAALPGVLALRDGRPVAAVVLGTVLPGLVTFALTVTPLSAVGAAAGAGLVVLVAVGAAALPRAEEGAVASVARRRVLGAVGSAVGVAGLGLVVHGTGEEPFPSPLEIPEDARPEVRDLLTQAQEQSFAVSGLEPLVSTDFYEVDINTINPDVDRSDWSLEVTGAVENEAEYDFADLEGMGFEDRFVTLRCVGDSLNGDKMDTALWSGVPVEEILSAAEPQGDRVVLHGDDGYYNEFPIEALWPGMLAYRMNGRPLPRGHGAPVRALVPGHWGEINVKWLTEIEVTREDTQGYWEQRGWHGTGPVHTVAKLWQDNYLGGGRMEVAGHAYAGTRGIQAVEVSTDGGDTWTEAELSEPLPGDDVWRQWRHEFVATGPREVVVRAVDGNGDVQIPERQSARPNGATGWVSETVRPQ